MLSLYNASSLHYGKEEKHNPTTSTNNKNALLCQCEIRVNLPSLEVSCKGTRDSKMKTVKWTNSVPGGRKKKKKGHRPFLWTGVNEAHDEHNF